MVANVNIEDFPYEVLSAIFGWISFEQLHRNAKFVCKKWYSAVLMDFSHPRSLLIDGTNLNTASIRISLFRPHISRLKFSHIDSNIVCKFFDTRDQFPNLKSLSIVWRRIHLPSACKLSTTSLCGILDRCPKLDRLYLKNCFIYESTSHLVEKIAAKRIRSLAIMNKYQFLDEVDRFYELENMKELKIYRCGSAEAIQRVCQTNGSSLTSLGAHTDGCRSNSAQRVEVLQNIRACSQLVRLHLGVGLSVQTPEAWTGIANLSKLRFLSVEIDHMPTKEFVSVFSRSFVGKLHSLGVRWNRRVDVEELKCLNRLQLPQLSLAFMEDKKNEESRSVLAAVVDMVELNHVLRRLKVETYFYDVDFLLWLCSAAPTELRSAKIRQICNSLNPNSVDYDLQRVSQLISFGYSLEYTISDSVLEVVITKK